MYTGLEDGRRACRYPCPQGNAVQSRYWSSGREKWGSRKKAQLFQGVDGKDLAGEGSVP